MTTLINNKTFKRFLGIALTILLVVTLMPQVQPAYGDGETATAPEATAFAEEPSDAEAPDEPQGDQNDEGAEAPAEIIAEQDIIRIAGTGNVENYTFTDGTHTIVLEDGAELKGNIRLSGDAVLNLQGNGTIEGNGDGSVIIVEGQAKLYLNPENRDSSGDVTGTNNVTITGGTGTLVYADMRIRNSSGNWVAEPNSQWTSDDWYSTTEDYTAGRTYVAGGGILVQRDADKTAGAGLYMYGGKVQGNTANAGGGIFIDRDCSFYMGAGTVSENTARVYEGGGIYVAGHSGGKSVVEQKDGTEKVVEHATIAAGAISNNTCETSIAWGGGGVFVESKGVLKVESALVAANTADGLGGGISGCPHANIGIGDITEGAAIYGNTAYKTSQPSNKYLHVLKTDSSYNAEQKVFSGDMYAYGLTEENIWNSSWKNTGLSGDYAKAAFTQDKAMDYYCTKVSYVHGYDLGQNDANAWIGYTAGKTQSGANFAKDVAILKDQTYVANDASLGLTSTKTLEFVTEQTTEEGASFQVVSQDELKASASYQADTRNRKVIITDNVSRTHGGGIGCNGALLIGDLGSTVKYDPFSFTFTKKFVNDDANPDTLDLTGGEFKFELFEDEECTKKVTDSVINSLKDDQGNATGTVANDSSGHVTFKLDTQAYIEDYRAEYSSDPTKLSFTFYVREVNELVDEEAGEKQDPEIAYDQKAHKITLELDVVKEESCIVRDAVYLTTYRNTIRSIAFDDGNSDLTIVNVLKLEGLWHPEATKFYFGEHEDQSGEHQFTFTLQGLKGDVLNDPAFDWANVSLRDLIRDADAQPVNGNGSVADTYEDKGQEGFKATGYNRAFGSGQSHDEARVVFPGIEYHAQGDYWYLMTETDAADPVAYVLRVTVAKNVDKKGYGAAVTAVYYAPTLSATALSPITEVHPSDEGAGSVPDLKFYNSDTAMAFSLYGYGVNAMSGEPVEQQCLVDPKVIKQLDGRAIKADEFRFKLIQVMEKDDWSNTSGPEISATTNDEFGMVDFDKANNLAADGLDPCCLLFTAPGTYQYRVIEDTDYRKDPSIAYSDQVITFTAVIELDQATGQLICTDMFYGYLNDQGQNVRYKDQYTGWENKDENWVPTAADFPLLNMDWHPTITNKAKPMDLKVRKTSVLDRNEGLEGATYGLYMVNEAEQGDVLLASATSDAEGWIYFEDVNLNAGALYYFKEQAAPAGHTVSEFRSPYFYVEVATDEATGFATYTMKYTDTKLALAAAEAAATEEVALGTLVVEALEASENASGQSVPAPADEEASGTSEGSAGEGSTGAAEPTPVTESHPEYTDDGALLFTYEYEGGVFDEATLVEFNKLDTRTHEWVEGAELSIVEKDSGQVVTSWVSGAAPERLEKLLNVGVTYVLREDKAPENYQKANDVEFVIDDYGNVEILSGTDNGNAELRDSTIILYDTMFDAEEVITQERETVREVPQTGKTVDNLAKTGDWLPLTGLGLLALAALGVAIAALRRSRKAGK